jgi:hypothetical protein
MLARQLSSHQRQRVQAMLCALQRSLMDRQHLPLMVQVFLRVMTLGVKCGDEVVVTVEGSTEDETIAKLQEIVESNDH